jgi:eukaryotic-like serine/threonine-protein kinase
MSLPQIAGLELLESIGSGSVGTVYRATSGNGRECAVKVLNSMAVNRKGLEFTLQLLQAMPPHRGVLPVIGYDLQHSPYHVTSPLVGTGTAESALRGWKTPHLESICGKVTPDQAWALIYELADSLGYMHRYGIAHGNLTSQNILLDSTADTRTRIGDVGQGWVGGVHHIELRHHYLFLCPEQASNPGGFFQGQGMSWDVYSFGVVAYRLLTGQYPRGAAAWVQELNRQQTAISKGLTYSINGDAILQAVQEQPQIEWPTQPASHWEERRRKVIETALELEGGARWLDMRDITREFEMMEADFLLEEARAATDFERERQAGRIAKLSTAWQSLSLLLIGCGSYAVYTQLALNGARSEIQENQTESIAQITTRDSKIGDLTGQLSTAHEAKKGVDANLQRSQAMVDQMLTQLLQLPTGNNLEVAFSRQQLEEAAEYLLAAIPALEKEPAMAPERARAYGNLGMIYHKQRRPNEARQYLEKARTELQTLVAEDKDPAHKALHHQWLGRYSLLLGGIASSRGDGVTAMTLLKEATENLDPGLQSAQTSRNARYEAAQAWFSYGVRCRMEGDAAGAAEAMNKVASAIEGNASSEPMLDEEMFLLARADLERGLALRDTGKWEDSISTLIDAVDQMNILVSGSAPKNQEQALILAEAYTELADLIAQQLTPKEASEAYDEAGKVLIELIRLDPQWVEAKYLMAKNYGALAGLSRDDGRPGEALSQKKTAIEQIGEVVGADPENPRYVFLKAKLKGELAEIMTDMGQAKSAVAIADDAAKSLAALLNGQQTTQITAERKHWEIALAVLHGIAAQTLEATKQREQAKARFQVALDQWKKVSVADAGNPSVQQGLTWVQNRLDKLK